MSKWYQIFPKNTGLSIYIWIIFCLIPFYFLFKSSPTIDFFIGIIMVILFFIAYRLSFISETWFVYVWVSLGMLISMLMTLFYGYVYFALFLSFFIGQVKSKAGFISLYVVHLVTTVLTINIGFFIKTNMFVSQLPFIIISIIGISLLPFNIYNRNKQERLEGLLESATTQLAITDERQRISRDLHDTLGQKLSLIGMKADLATKLVDIKPDQAKTEIKDIQHTARTALNEVRELVSNMRLIKLSEELLRVEQILIAADIKVKINGNTELKTTSILDENVINICLKERKTKIKVKNNGNQEIKKISILAENVLSMCLKEATTNIVRHSKANLCEIKISETNEETSIMIKDNGIGFDQQTISYSTHGIRGMIERLEFMNGNLSIHSNNGTQIKISFPKIISQAEETV